MSSVHRRKIANKYAGDMNDIIYGEDSAAAKAQQGLDIVSLLAKGGSEMAAKKAAADKAASDAAALKKAQDEAAQAQSDALVAQSAAVFETDPNGPKHQAAAAAMVKAQIAQQKVMAVQSGTSMVPMMPGASPAGGKSSAHPWYFWPAIAGGVALGGAIIYRLVSHGGGRRSSSRYVSEAR